MDVFVARQPIFDRRRQVYGYELLFRSGLTNAFEAAATDPDRASVKLIADSFLGFGLGRITGGKRAFINFTRDTLVKGYATLLPRELIVVEILENVEGDDEVLEACRDLKRRGYLIALDDFLCDDWSNPLVAFADIVKVDFRSTSPAARSALPELLATRRIKALAEKVETRLEFDEAVRLGFEYLQGFFFAKPAVLVTRDVPGYRRRYLEILREINRPSLDFAQIEEILRREPSLAYKLMTYINAVAFGFRSRITSIRQALMLLGEDAVKKWASVVALAGLAQDQPGELLVMSLARARFCETVAPGLGLKPRSAELFLMGLFSLLDAISGRPLAELLADLPLADDVQDALRGRPGALADVLSCARACERGEWTVLAEAAGRLGLDEGGVAQLHLECIAWAHESFPGAPDT